MEVAEPQSKPIERDGISEDALAVSKALRALLVTKCEGTALSIVSPAPKRRGLDCWRQLKLEYEGLQGSRLAAVLFGILNPGQR